MRKGLVILVRYNPTLDKIAKKLKFIPYRLKENSDYQVNRIYWSDYWGSYFRVIKIGYTGKHLGVDVKYQDGNYGHIETDLCKYDFLLEYDHTGISEKDIINSNISYTGAQIEYWIFCNYNDNDNPVYKMFRKYLDNNSRMRIDPYNYYFVCLEEKNGESRLYMRRDRKKKPKYYCARD